MLTSSRRLAHRCQPVRRGSPAQGPGRGRPRDLDRRLGQIDTTIEEAAKRGRTTAALSAIDGQKKARAALVDERKREAAILVALQMERASVAAEG